MRAGRAQTKYGVGQAPKDVPDELFRREARLKRIQEAKEELEREAADARAETLRENAAGQRAKVADESILSSVPGRRRALQGRGTGQRPVVEGSGRRR